MRAFSGWRFTRCSGLSGQAGSRYVFVYYTSPCPIDVIDPTRIDLLGCDPEFCYSEAQRRRRAVHAHALGRRA